jgi:hypothetical protein
MTRILEYCALPPNNLFKTQFEISWKIPTSDLCYKKGNIKVSPDHN